MKLRTEQPHFVAMCKDGSAWTLRPEDWDDFAAHWTAGKTFWSGVNLWDQSLIIKLADVTGMIALTAEALALFAEEAAEERHRAMMEGRE